MLIHRYGLSWRYVLIFLVAPVTIGITSATNPKLAAIAVLGVLLSLVLYVEYWHIPLLIIVATVLDKFSFFHGFQHLHVATVVSAVGGVLAFLRVRRIPTTPAFKWLFLWVMMNVLSTILFAPDKFESFKIVFWLVSSLAGYFTVIAASHSKLRRMHVIVLFSILGVLESFLGIAMVGLHKSFGVQYSYHGFLRVSGTMVEPNLYGSFVMIGFFCTVLLLGTVKRPLWKWYAVLGSLLCLVGILLSYTRAVWIATAVSTLWFIVRSLPRGGRRVLYLILAVSVPLLIYYITVLGAYLIANLYDLSTRFNAYAIAFRQMKNGGPTTILLGMGTNSFGQRYIDPVLHLPGYLSGMFLQNFYDTGVLGTVLLFGALWQLGKFLLSTDTFQNRILFAALLAVILAYQLTTGFWFSYTWVLMAIVYLPEHKTDSHGLTSRGKSSLRLMLSRRGSSEDRF